MATNQKKIYVCVCVCVCIYHAKEIKIRVLIPLVQWAIHEEWRCTCLQHYPVSSNSLAGHTMPACKH